MIFHSDYNNLFLKEGDIIPKLKNLGFALPESWYGIGGVVPRWYKLYMGRRMFSAAEVVRILCGIDPAYNGPLNESDDLEYDRYMALFIDSVKHGELVGKVDDTPDQAYLWEVSHDDVRSWCKANSLDWPLRKLKEVNPSDSLSATEELERVLELQGFLNSDLREEVQARLEAEQRAEQAELALEECRQELTLALSKRELIVTKPTDPGCLTFPYATKQLEAMRDAALAHWANHDRSKPAPYGIQKTVATFLASRTGENARKLAELAAAIKPDDLPKG
ncbi:hypothetical protein [Pseudomonas chlororaphis]|uniref:hypothetical protein n=1 Tax=Pseudomonas chlororaphis TaxID=587753 RepID=UPI0011CD6CB9|nr:hypothetical protein [Pseudomonas chlororaphis]